jgi:hypothetical protein
MLLGHNPHWDEAAEHFSGMAIELKTSSALLLMSELDPKASWVDAINGP